MQTVKFKIIAFTLLFSTILSSGFFQFTKHICTEHKVNFMQKKCLNSNSCCANLLKVNAIKHCSTKFIFSLSAKFKELTQTLKTHTYAIIKLVNVSLNIQNIIFYKPNVPLAHFSFYETFRQVICIWII